MKKVLSIFAVALMTIGMVSCDKTSADNDDVYVETSANDNDSASSSGGSGSNSN